MRAIEFYSGVGGWNCAIKTALGAGVEVVSAYDVNPAANAVYAINHGSRPSAKSLEVVTAEELDAYYADIWMMSPPCQPHTRNNTTAKRDGADPRSASFSESRVELSSSDILSVRTELAGVTSGEEVSFLENYLESSDADVSAYVIEKEYISSHRQSCWCWDIVTRHSQKTACFTKGYTRYHKGTGSVLLVNGNMDVVPSMDSEHEYDGEWVEKLLSNENAYLRYLTPTELLRLFGFPDSFSWPADVSKRKRFELIGNSINVHVTSRLLRYLL
eukprot:gene34413-41652_t